MQEKQLNETPVTYETASGVIDFPLTDDVVFHYVMQKSERALTGLVCSLKGIRPESINKIVIKNAIDINALSKETVLDLILELNSGEIMNIELQIYNDKYWIPRSILYLCRAYDSIGEGDAYSELKPTTHYCITNQKLFPENGEFYSKYLLLNTKTHKPYTNNFGINVLQLKYINNATEEDISNNLVYWAKLFNASSWEEFRALAGDDEVIQEVGTMILELNTDEQTRYNLEGQRRYREQMASQYTAGYTDAEDAYKSIIAEKDARIAELEAKLAQSETSSQETIQETIGASSLLTVCEQRGADMLFT